MHDLATKDNLAAALQAFERRVTLMIGITFTAIFLAAVTVLSL